MLLTLLGWDIEKEQNKFDFYQVIQEVQEMMSTEEYGIKQFKEYFDKQCNLGEIEKQKQGII